MGNLIWKTTTSVVLGLALGFAGSITMAYLDGDNAQAEIVCVNRHGVTIPCNDINPAILRQFGEKAAH